MAQLSGSAKKKKQKEKERELQRLKVIEERQAGSDTSPDEEIPATQPYGPWEEPKEKWDARLEAQPPAEKYSEFEKRAKARKGQPIEYQPAAISDEPWAPAMPATPRVAPAASATAEAPARKRLRANMKSPCSEGKSPHRGPR